MRERKTICHGHTHESTGYTYKDTAVARRADDLVRQAVALASEAVSLSEAAEATVWGMEKAKSHLVDGVNSAADTVSARIKTMLGTLTAVRVGLVDWTPADD